MKKGLEHREITLEYSQYYFAWAEKNLLRNSIIWQLKIMNSILPMTKKGMKRFKLTQIEVCFRHSLVLEQQEAYVGSSRVWRNKRH